MFINGKIMTMNNCEIVEAFLVEEDRFVKVGSNEEVLKLSDENTKIVDLERKWVIPGFNDSHMHLISYGLSTKKVDLRQCKSLEDIKTTIKNYIEGLETNYFGEWIVGHGWNEENFTQSILPTADFLDEITKEYPIYISRACYHICGVNSRGLELAGINENSIDPEGGKIDRYDNTTMPNGILRENALLLAFEKIPMMTEVEQIKSVLQDAVKDALKVGLTSIQTEDFGQVEDFTKVIKAYQELEAEGKLHCRINLQMLLQEEEKLQKLIDLGYKTGMGGDFFKIGPLKMLADGSLGGRTAALLEPYQDDPDNRGILIFQKERLKEHLSKANENGIQLAVHAIGDRTMDQLLSIFEELLDEKEDKRPRLIHCQITNQGLIERMGRLKVIADIQPGFLPTDLKMVEARVGVARGKDSYAWKSMLKAGVKVAGGSDCPIESFNPFLGIYGAVTRKDYEGNPTEGWNLEECLSIEESIGLYTTGSSYATFEENNKGKIQEGYFADFLIIQEDIKAIPTTSLKDVNVLETYVAGECKYKLK